MILLPGHTPGSIGLLERNHRFMLTGDTVHYGPVHMFGPGRNLQAYKHSLIKLKQMSDKVDVFYACHHKLEATPDILEDLLEGVEKVLSGQLKGETEVMKNRTVLRYNFRRISFYA